MQKLMFLVVGLLISGCLSQMEKVTSDTKDAVEETKRGQQLSVALDFLFNEHYALAIRSAAADTVFTLAPDNRIFRYLGCRLPLSFGTDPETKIPNVSRVLLSSEWDPSKSIRVYPGISAPISPSVLLALEDAAFSILKLTLLTAKGNPSPEQYNEFKTRAVRMVGIGTAIFGARSHTKMSQYFRDLEGVKFPIVSRGEEVEVKSDFIRVRGAQLLRDVAITYQFSPDETNALVVLTSERLGVDYKSIDEMVSRMNTKYGNIDR